jgi:hypothetical protein
MLFPMRGLSYVTVAELKCLYAIVHKIRYSQVVDIVNYFKKIRTLAGPIECTSMITRITLNLGCPEMAHMSYIEGGVATILHCSSEQSRQNMLQDKLI